MANPQRPPPFPSANTPRTWLITAAASPVGLTLSRALLAHGDKLILGVLPAERDAQAGGARAQDLAQFVDEAHGQGWTEKFKIVDLDGRHIGQCQSAVAEAVDTYGGLDILFCCSSEAVVGTIEELSVSQRTRTLTREQMETNFFGPTNIIKAALPAMREKRTGHIMVLTGITSHLGTPGLGIYCAAGWALEGFCDSLAYEVAPFNIKLTIVQPNLEISVLLNKISSAPQMPEYANPNHPAPLSRAILARILDRLGVTSPPGSSEASLGNGGGSSEEAEAAGMPKEDFKKSGNRASGGSSSTAADTATAAPSLLTPRTTTLEASLPARFVKPLLAETVYAICAIGGHENPPARHIVGNEAVNSVKEKLKTVSEELEDFIEVSSAVDIDDGGGGGGGVVGAGSARKSAEHDEDGSVSMGGRARGKASSFGASPGSMSASGSFAAMSRKKSDDDGSMTSGAAQAAAGDDMEFEAETVAAAPARKGKGKARAKA